MTVVDVKDATLKGQVTGPTFTGNVDGAKFSGSVTYTETTTPPVEPPIEPPTASISLFTTQLPAMINNSDGASVTYELGTKFKSSAAGQITHLRFWKGDKEVGTHTGNIWSATGSKLASVTFAGETASGWQTQKLSSPLNITADTTYIASVGTSNNYFSTTENGLAAAINNGSLSTIVGNNGVYGPRGACPGQTSRNNNYFRDIVFVSSGVTTPPVEPPIEPPVIPPSSDAFWTKFTATEPSGEGSTFTGAGTRKIYVSTSGNDSNPGTQASPKKTIRTGILALRKGKADWLLFKKGDTWTNEDFGNLSGYSGVSPTAPMLFGAYGTGKRPKFQTHTDNAVGFYSETANNVAFVGLEFYAYKRDPNNASFDANSNTAYNHGFVCNAPSNYLLIEDCRFSFYGDNIVVQGAVDVFKLRRCVVVDAYIKSASTHSQGIYTQNIKNQIIEENIFDHCGWNSKVGGDAGATIYNRNAYLDAESGPATVIGNWFSASSSEGAQVRSAGTIKHNFFYQNTTGMNVGSDDLPFKVSDTSDNVIMHSQSGRPGRQGYGICVLNVQTSNVKICNNIISHDEDKANPQEGRGLFLDQKTSEVVMTHNIIFKWPHGILNYGNANNITEPNSVDLAGTNSAGYSAPNRDLGDYYASVGGTNSSADFITAIRNQSKDTWNDKLTAKAVVNYIRGGFDLPAI